MDGQQRAKRISQTSSKRPALALQRVDARLEALRDAVHQGTYQIDPMAIACSMLAHVFARHTRAADNN
jgi:anti-sigma28 factor (negative regulator of flagellin synthesis)